MLGAISNKSYRRYAEVIDNVLGPPVVAEDEQKEKDPAGLDQHEPGAKLDDGKPRPDLVLGDFARALQSVVDVGTYGANKYSEHGWLSVKEGVIRYEDAMMRHYLKLKAGEELDGKSGLMHRAQIAWNALASLELYLKDQEAAEANG